MPTWTETQARLLAAAPATRTIGRRTVVDHYGDPLAEYRAAEAGGGICDRADRGVLRVTGRDRAAWLHNLTTNQVKTLAAGEWRYAFVLNVKGRILFDLTLLVDEDWIWLDLDDRFVAPALAHFNKYTIVEDVQVQDVSDQFARFTILGASEPRGLPLRSPEPVNSSDAQVADRWTWGRFPFEGSSILSWHDPASSIETTDVIVPVEIAGGLWMHLANPPLTKGGQGGGSGALLEDSPAPAVYPSPLTPHPSLQPIGWSALTPVGRSAFEARRIESGIPAPVSELNEEALPAETGQLDRAVSFTKGCYLGQEVVERMRAHKSLARRLVGIVFNEFETRNSKLETNPPVPILIDAKPAGTLTSICHSPKLNRTIGLGYVRVAQSAPGTKVLIADQEAAVTSLPFQV